MFKFFVTFLDNFETLEIILKNGNWPFCLKMRHLLFWFILHAVDATKAGSLWSHNLYLKVKVCLFMFTSQPTILYQEKEWFGCARYQKFWLAKMDYQIELFHAISIKYRYQYWLLNSLLEQNSPTVRCTALRTTYWVNVANNSTWTTDYMWFSWPCWSLQVVFFWIYWI